MGHNGFTLIELMIVIAIIAVLSAIAIPEMGQMARKCREGTTKGNLASLRSVIALAYTNAEGVYPKGNLEAVLVPAYLSQMPLKDTPPYHPNGNSVGSGNMAAMTLDRGDWYYDNDPTEIQFGQVFVNCVHSDLNGRAWSIY